MCPLSRVSKFRGVDCLRAAYRAVRANNGASGIDGETVDAFGENLEARLAEIPKPDGSKRPLGIPTVGDRVVQQALLNVVQPIFDPEFHPSSYGYRPGRSCHQAVAKAERFINRYGLKHVVDMDLSKCFDRLDHDLIIEFVNRKVSDGSVLKLIRKFLEAGVMKDGAWEETTIGNPQGGVISPLFANIYLDYFDQKMKSKDIRIVRYADDILIFARTKRQAEKFLEIACEILEGELKLVVNRDKTHITSVYKGVPYLGFVIYPKKLAKFKDAVRKLTPRNHGMSVEQMVKRLNRFLIANCKTIVASLMGWIRRRLRMKQMGEWKSWRGLHKALRRRGYSGEFLKISMRRWRNSASPLVNMALPQAWFSEIGLIGLTKYEVVSYEAK
ncbi:MAG: group II intron reverse transcriptase/maturase [Bacillota bacterium]